MASDVLAFLHHTRPGHLSGGWGNGCHLKTLSPRSFRPKRGKNEKRGPKDHLEPGHGREGRLSSTSCRRRSSSSPRAIIDTFRGRISPETGEVLLPEIGLTAEELERISRIVMVACGTSWHAGPGGKVSFGGILPHPGGRGLGLRVPLPEPACRSQDPAYSDLPIRRDGRYPGRHAGRTRQRGPGLGHLQRRGQQHRPGGRRGDLYPRRTGNRGGLHQGLYHPVGGPLSS